MATQQELAAAMRHLQPNAHWRQYVETLEHTYNKQIKALLFAAESDVHALRGECRALYQLLHNINTQNGGLTS